MGWSCGGGMAHFAAVDRALIPLVALNSGLGIYGDRQSYYPRFHSPLAIFNGNSSDVAYNPGMQEYSEVTNVPVYHANYPQGHGDAYFQDNGGEFGIVAVGWLNFMLKMTWAQPVKACSSATIAAYVNLLGLLNPKDLIKHKKGLHLQPFLLIRRHNRSS